MSAIDPKHLIAPFKNTVHLITIVFTVLLFAVYRLATGGIEVVERGPNSAPLPQAPGAAAPGAFAQPTAHAVAVVPTVSINASPQGVADDMQKLLGGGPVKPKDQNAKPKEDGSADLNDIERALGLAK